MAGQANFSFQDNMSLSSAFSSNQSLLGLKGTRGLMLQAIKKQGVSGESCDIMGSQASDISVPKYEKDYSSKILIKNAIMENDFLKNIDALQIKEIIDSMYNLEYHAGEYVIKEGDSGAHLYVSGMKMTSK
jgi:cGMP-dependent protein kinase